MSNLQSKMSGVKFEPIAVGEHRAPGEGMLAVGVIYPAGVIALELALRLCAQSLFDPMPTYWHTAAVCLVPAANLLIWYHLRNGARWNVNVLAFANGFSISIAGLYALLFLPLVPLAVVGVLFLFGLLPLAPLASFAVAVKLCRAFCARHHGQPLTGPLLSGLAAGLALLLALDIPAAATRLGLQWAASNVASERAWGLKLLRTLGDDDLLLRLCYDAVGRPAGLLSALVMFDGGPWLGPPQRQVAQSPAQAREIYYRVHGVPFNAKPAPFEKGGWSRLADFRFDDDHGGTQVGGRLKGLDLVSSRIDGSISGDDAVAYLEWAVEFRNSGPIDREARLQVALPPGGVVSRATLWVNGEEREAAYGGRGEVRAAYQRVAVQQRRDPLLVTTKGADRVLAQAFPVPRNGGTIKFKLGITAPLEIADPSHARLTLPALVDRNFSFAPETTHSVWIEGKQPLGVSAPGLIASRVDARLFRISGSLDDRELSPIRPTVAADRNPGSSRLAAHLGEGEAVVQEIAASAPDAAGTMMLVIDGSAGLAHATASLIKALDAIPPTSRVGAIIAADETRQVAPAPWSDRQKQAVVNLLRSTSYVGGQDNGPALAEALGMLETEAKATLVWIHGPQPVSFRGSAARLEQAGAHLSHVPDVILYGVEGGPNEILPDAPWAWTARSLPPTGSIEADLSGLFARASQTQAFVIHRSEGHPVEGLATGSDHIARLWARDRVLELMRARPTDNRAAAVALAARYRLVTPVSGAVVLEARQQYDEARLAPVSQATVPTVPEPHEWALILIVAFGLLWLAWRDRQRFAAA